MSSDATSAPRTGRSWPAIVALVGTVVALGVGGWLLWRSLTSPATFGWFAYAPLSETVSSTDSRTSAFAGITLVALGSLGLGALGGYALARRRARR